MKYRYEELTWEEIKEAVAQEKIPVLPIGSIEQHGPHLPIDTDSRIIWEVCRRGVEQAGEEALLMPLVCYGYSPHHMAFPGSIAIRPETFLGYLVDIGTSLARHGFKRILIANGHGGNAPLATAAAYEITMTTDSVCGMTSWWRLIVETLQAIRESEFPGGMSHSCEAETSALLYLRPDLVKMEKAAKHILKNQTEFIQYDLISTAPVAILEPFSRLSETGVQGDPTLATKEKGKIIVEKAAERLAEFIREFKRREISPTPPDHH